MALFYGVPLLLAVGHPQGWIGRFFRLRVFREVGVVSYCIFLIHVVVNVVLHAVAAILDRAGAAVTMLAALM